MLMKTLLLATSEQRPLGQFDSNLPSPMVPLLNRPLMRHMVELLHNHGVRDIHVSLYEFGETIEEYFGHGQKWGVDFTYLLQHEPLGSAGAIRRAKYHIDETFVILPADIYIDFDVQTALNFHRKQDGIATAILQAQPDFSINQIEKVSLDEDGYVIATDADISESERTYLSTGVYFFEPEVLAYIPKDTKYDTFDELLPTLLQADKRVAAYVNNGYWNPCDSFPAYQHAQQTLLTDLMADDNMIGSDRGMRSVTSEGLSEGVWLGRDIALHPEARIHPPVYIGTGSQLLPQAEIGPNVVIGSHVVVGRGTSIKESTVLDNTFIGELLDVEHKVINRRAIIDMKRDEVVNVDEPYLLADISPTFYSNYIQTLLEKLIGGLIFFVLSPVMLLIILLLLWTSRESVFDLVERIVARSEGLADSSQRGPHSIFVTHFRTRDAAKQYTKVGRWLERWELYRLPALWNVLTGELSLVGVQPLSADEALLIQDEWQTIRFSSKAGFTGFWYTQAAADADFLERSTVDAYYTATRSLAVDLFQVAATPLAWLKRRQG